MAERGAQEPFDYLGQWAEEPEATQLVGPSGKRYRVRTPDLPALARGGHIPNHLLPVVEKFVLNEAAELRKVAPDADPDAKPGERLVRIAEFDGYVDAYCVASVVEPPLSFDGAAGTIAIGRVPKVDRYHIWRWGAGLVQAVAAFPGDGDGAAGAVPPAPDGEGVREPAKRAARPRRAAPRVDRVPA